MTHVPDAAKQHTVAKFPWLQLLSRPYSYSFTIVANFKPRGEIIQWRGKPLSVGHPALTMGFYPSRGGSTLPTVFPFWEEGYVGLSLITG